MSGKIKSLSDFLALLQGVKQVQDGQYNALCPGHPDNKPSLSIKEADDKILVRCFARCELADILKPLGLESSDLFINGHKTNREHKEIQAVYNYVDANGKPYEVVRFKPKQFAQRQPDGTGGYIWSLKGIVPTLYHQGELKQAIDSGQLIYIVEGEKDCDNLWAIGLASTTNPMGVRKWCDSYSEILRGADLIIIPDNDDPGCDHANNVAKSCYGIAKKIRLLKLPGESKDVSHWLDNGGSVEQLEKLLANCQDYEPPPYATLPEIVVTDRHLRDITADALEALYKANKPEHIFRRSGALTRISLDEKQRPYTEVLGESAFRGCLARSCNFVRITVKGDRVAVPPPLDVVRDCLSLGEWQFPALLGITEAPLIRPDGTVMNKPGYDSATNLYYHPSPKLTVPPIPDKPRDSDIKGAIELALEPLTDFPFDTEASRANAIATMFTPILRPMIDGPTPLALFDKPQQGTGASLLAEVTTFIATGRAAAMMTAQRDDEGWRKVITSLLLKGQLVVTIDNIEYDLWAPSLAAILTATSYQDRILGRSEIVILPNRTTWLATGNNIRLRGDLPRRCIWVRMDARMAQPWLRDLSGFKHPRLIEWVSANRGGILAAILTIARAWVVAGMPEAKGLPNFGGYESYCRVVGGVLTYMGVSGFLENLDAMYNETDTETPQWECFLETWHDVLGDKAVTAAELISHINDNAELRAALPDAVAQTEAGNYIRRLGNSLAKKKGVRFPHGLSIVKAGEYNRAAKWQVMSPQKADSCQSSFNYESYESNITPVRGTINNDNNKYLYKDRPQQASEDSYLASKKHESDYAAVLGMPVDDAIEVWRSVGAPIIHLGPGVNCLDLVKLLSEPDLTPEHLEAVKAWLQEHKGGELC